jgi:hypothetical protein
LQILQAKAMDDVALEGYDFAIEREHWWTNPCTDADDWCGEWRPSNTG